MLKKGVLEKNTFQKFFFTPYYLQFFVEHALVFDALLVVVLLTFLAMIYPPCIIKLSNFVFFIHTDRF